MTSEKQDMNSYSLRPPSVVEYGKGEGSFIEMIREHDLALGHLGVGNKCLSVRLEASEFHWQALGMFGKQDEKEFQWACGQSKFATCVKVDQVNLEVNALLKELCTS